MTSNAGSKLFDMIVDARAEQLLTEMQSCSPEEGSTMSQVEKDQALVTALTALENDPEALPLSQVIFNRAKEIFFTRSTLKN